MKKKCIQCAKEFLVIDPEQRFLTEKDLPFPTRCPFCRQKRRLLLRGKERNLYRTKCEKCKKSIVTAYDPKKVATPVLCFIHYDEFLAERNLPIEDDLLKTELTAKMFFKELEKLIDMYAKHPNRSENCENCDFGEYNFYCKNLSYSFDCYKTNDGVFLYDCLSSANSMDCDYAIESELCYESVDHHKCFNCDYLENCENMTDSSFCYKSTNCHDVFGCVYLQNKSFCIFNRQLNEQEYKKKVKEYKKWPAKKVLAKVEELKKRFPLTQTNQAHNENSDYGDYVYYCKNCYLCFDATNSEESGYIFDCIRGKMCYDLYYSAENELSYELVNSGHCFNTDYAVYSIRCQDSSYLFNCADVKHSLGCVSRTHCEYTILNRQYTKEKYEKLSRKILSEIREKSLGWGNLTYY